MNPNSFLATTETRQLVDWVNANRPNSNAARLFRTYAPPEYPTTNLQDIGSPLSGANVWSTTPDGIPDIGSINVVQNGPRDGDQFNGRFDQVNYQGVSAQVIRRYASGWSVQGAYTYGVSKDQPASSMWISPIPISTTATPATTSGTRSP